MRAVMKLTGVRRARAVSIEARLVLLTVTASLAAAVVGGTAVSSVRAMSDSSDRSAYVQALLSQHQDADMVHDALRAGVLEALVVDQAERQALQTRTTEDARQLAADLDAAQAALAGLGDDQLSAEYDLATQSLTAYADTAVRLVTTSSQRPVEQADIALFAGDFEQTRERMVLLTESLRRLSQEAESSARSTAAQAQLRTGVVTLLTLLVLVLLAGWTRRSVRASLADKARAEQAVRDAKEQLEQDAARERFTSTLKDAFDMAVDEEEATDVVRRTVLAVVPHTRAELLLADNSRAHLTRTLEEPDGASPGCGVVAPSDCIAVRRSRTAVFEEADGIGACPKLTGRAGEVGQAVCSPVTFLGEGLGVLHVVSPVGERLEPAAVAALATTADEAGSRIGTLRAFARSQLQANTDGLTGLLNRRTAEDRTATLQRAGRSVAVAMCDLDHFKNINDTFGHEAGDRALRVFAGVLRSVMRTEDVVARYGGEEFLLVMPDCPLDSAVEVLERIRTELDLTLQAGGAPAFTASFGVALALPDRPLEAAVKAADHALMQAKQQGRNRTVVAEGDLPVPVPLPLARLASASG